MQIISLIFNDYFLKRTIEDFIQKGLPEEWFDYARELKEASDDLWEMSNKTHIVFQTENKNISKLNYSRTFFLLNGFSIENLLKGILISEKPNLIAGGKISSEISSGHNLIKLSQKILSINFTNRDNEIMQLLSEVVPYWGKYPIPKKYSDLVDETFFNNDFKKDLDLLNLKLQKKLYYLNKDGIKGPNGINFPKLIIPHLDE